ncbi:Cilia- and flagella-associated protein 251 [Coelomomyces lativittatus]|nr:Cilia- and flagella-associated protein 251 [Coelomomyces lativittatus]
MPSTKTLVLEHVVGFDYDCSHGVHAMDQKMSVSLDGKGTSPASNLTQEKEPIPPSISSSSSSTFGPFVYVADNVGIVALDAHTQHLLQGHTHRISSLTVSSNQQWILTVDQGPNPILVVWETQTYSPIQTFFDLHQYGGAYSVVMSEDMKWIATLGGKNLGR